MLVTINHILEEQAFNGLTSLDSIIDLLLTQDKQRVLRNDRENAGKQKVDNVDKCFILSLNPTLANYKVNVDCLSLITKLDRFIKPIRTVSPMSNFSL